MKKQIIIKRYSEELKRAAVECVEEQCWDKKDVCKYYQISNIRSLNRWIQIYGKMKNSTKVVRVIMKNEQEKIRELESLIADLHIKNKVLSTQVQIYEEKTAGENKKKLSTKQLEELERLKQKLKGLNS